MKIIIFGGSGFLGSHVADVLSESGHKVTIYDLTESPYLKKEQRIIRGDILDYKQVESAISGHDIVYNFAGIADIDEANKSAIDTVKINILGNVNLLEASKNKGIKRFVFASSVYVYSEVGSFYRCSKQACELLIENYQKIFGLDYTILRYGSLYGVRANELNWIYQILKQALTEKKITRFGDGEEIREYIHVEDAARYSVEILIPEYINKHVVISGYQQIKIKDLLTMISEILGDKIEIEYKPADSDLHYEITPYAFRPKIGIRLIGKQYLDLGQGILHCLEDMCKNLDPGLISEEVIGR